MSEGVDLIDIYADEEFNQVSGASGHGAGATEPPFLGESTVISVGQLVSKGLERLAWTYPPAGMNTLSGGRRCDLCAWEKVVQHWRVPVGNRGLGPFLNPHGCHLELGIIKGLSAGSTRGWSQNV